MGSILVAIFLFLVICFIILVVGAVTTSFRESHPNKTVQFFDSIKDLPTEERVKRIAERTNEQLKKDLHMK